VRSGNEFLHPVINANAVLQAAETNLGKNAFVTAAGPHPRPLEERGANAANQLSLVT
jgi:hypothetical protein